MTAVGLICYFKRMKKSGDSARLERKIKRLSSLTHVGSSLHLGRILENVMNAPKQVMSADAGCGW